jgi:hypothetical protein
MSVLAKSRCIELKSEGHIFYKEELLDRTGDLISFSMLPFLLSYQIVCKDKRALRDHENMSIVILSSLKLEVLYNRENLCTVE